MTGLAALAAPGAAWTHGAAAPAADLETGRALSRSRLRAHIDSTFLAWGGGARPARLRLRHVGEVSAAAAAGTVGADDCFSAEFVGTRHAPLAQGTCTLWHPSLGRCELFLVPVGRPGREARYEAVVNNHCTA